MMASGDDNIADLHDWLRLHIGLNSLLVMFDHYDQCFACRMIPPIRMIDIAYQFAHPECSSLLPSIEQLAQYYFQMRMAPDRVANPGIDARICFALLDEVIKCGERTAFHGIRSL